MTPLQLMVVLAAARSGEAFAESQPGTYVLDKGESVAGVVRQGKRTLPSCGDDAIAELYRRLPLKFVFSRDGSMKVNGQRWTNVDGSPQTEIPAEPRYQLALKIESTDRPKAWGVFLYRRVGDDNKDVCADRIVVSGRYKKQ